MSENKFDKSIIFKVLAFVGVAVVISGIVMTVTGFGDFESNNFMIGGFMVTFGIFATVLFFVKGFGSHFNKMNQNIEDIVANITKNATIGTDESDLKNNNSKKSSTCVCCGAKLSKHSSTCDYCGKEQ